MTRARVLCRTYCRSLVYSNSSTRSPRHTTASHMATKEQTTLPPAATASNHKKHQQHPAWLGRGIVYSEYDSIPACRMEHVQAAAVGLHRYLLLSGRPCRQLASPQTSSKDKRGNYEILLRTIDLLTDEQRQTVVDSNSTVYKFTPQIEGSLIIVPCVCPGDSRGGFVRVAYLK